MSSYCTERVCAAAPSLNEQEEHSLAGWLRLRQAELKSQIVNSPRFIAVAEQGAAAAGEGHVAARGLSLTRRSLLTWFAAEEAAADDDDDDADEAGGGDEDSETGKREIQEQAERATPVVRALHKQYAVPSHPNPMPQPTST